MLGAGTELNLQGTSRFIHYLVAYICRFYLFMFAPAPGKHYPWQSNHRGFCLEQLFKALEPMGAVWGCLSLPRLLLEFQTPESPWSCPKSSTEGWTEEELLMNVGTSDPWAPFLLHKTVWESPNTQPLHKRLWRTADARGVINNAEQVTALPLSPWSNSSKINEGGHHPPWASVSHAQPVLVLRHSGSTHCAVQSS